jgi:hypothetical protein
LDTRPRGALGNYRRSTIERMPDDRTSVSLDASLAIPTCVLRFEASRRARIPSLLTEPPVLVLWLNQVSRRFCCEPSQTLRADSGREPLPCTGSCPRLHLAFLAPHSTLLASGSLKLSLLVSPLLRGPTRHRPFALALHLQQRKSNLYLHLQYSAKSQSTAHCQSLIKARCDHPPVLECSGPQSPP